MTTYPFKCESVREFLVGLTMAGMLLGCGAASVDESTASAGFDRLVTLGEVYRQATLKRGSPPRSAEDLLAFCPAGMGVDELLRSPIDGEPITVFWGTDPQSGMDINPLVIAHEKTGGAKGRLVLTAMGVMLMPADAFAKARLPASTERP